MELTQSNSNNFNKVKSIVKSIRCNKVNPKLFPTRRKTILKSNYTNITKTQYKS